MSGVEQCSARDRLLEQVEEAARVIAPLWPLSTSIAVNPLWDLRHMTFDQAIHYSRQLLGISGYPSLSLIAKEYASGRITDEDIQAAIDRKLESVECSDSSDGFEYEYRARILTKSHNDVFRIETMSRIDREVGKWCAAYLAGILPSEPDQGFYESWRNVVVFDPSALSIVGKVGRRQMANLGGDSEAAILNCMDRLGIAEEDRVWELSQHLASMAGWAGHAKWRTFWAPAEQPGPALHLVDYLAVRLCYAVVLDDFAINTEAKLFNSNANVNNRKSDGSDDERSDRESINLAILVATGLPRYLVQRLAKLSINDIEKVLLAAYEGHYRDHLLAALASPIPKRTFRPSAQVVFCIDVRSEALRRNLESCGPYETFGFAGFFALPAIYTPWWSADKVNLCPVLIEPTFQLGDRPSITSDKFAWRELAGRQVLAAGTRAFDVTRKGAVSQFVLAEAGGFFAGPIGIAKTLAPTWYQKVRSIARRVITRPVETIMDLESSASGMTDEEQALWAATALSTMGLIRDFAPLVVLCGHGSSSDNNPYASSLDCGACGGNKGGTSARAVAAVLNRRIVRNLLVEQGISIPETTLFTAAEHDTTTDKVSVLDLHLIPTDHVEDVERLQLALNQAGIATATNRTAFLPGYEDNRHSTSPVGRAGDWAQVRPEWGLARNAAFIVAPRSISAEVDLESRCFLHSYYADSDPDGVVLEAILTAPMIVAHWINAQYYFSTVDPNVLSAGDKTAHNIVAGVGVLQGAGGDLKVGLPLQSLYEGEDLFHEPMRLLVVVEAPQMRLEAVIARNKVLQELFDGEWVLLVARDKSQDNWMIRRPGGDWDSWKAAGVHSTDHYKLGGVDPTRIQQ